MSLLKEKNNILYTKTTQDATPLTVTTARQEICRLFISHRNFRPIQEITSCVLLFNKMEDWPIEGLVLNRRHFRSHI